MPAHYVAASLDYTRKRFARGFSNDVIGYQVIRGLARKTHCMLCNRFVAGIMNGIAGKGDLSALDRLHTDQPIDKLVSGNVDALAIGQFQECI